MARSRVALLSVLLGAAVWLVGLLMGPGPTPFGVWYLLSVAVAGFSVALVEGGISWTGLTGLYAGQLMTLVLHGLLAPTEFKDEPLGWLPLFVLSFMPAAALGGILGAALRHPWRRGVELRDDDPDRDLMGESAGRPRRSTGGDVAGERLTG